MVWRSGVLLSGSRTVGMTDLQGLQVEFVRLYLAYKLGKGIHHLLSSCTYPPDIGSSRRAILTIAGLRSTLDLQASVRDGFSSR